MGSKVERERDAINMCGVWRIGKRKDMKMMYYVCTLHETNKKTQKLHAFYKVTHNK
jgi:hypothetical protein